MFKASITSQKLVECIDALKALVAEAEFSMKPEGIFVAAVDASIPDVGPVAAERLLRRFGSVEGVINATKQELLGIDRIGRRSLKR